MKFTNNLTHAQTVDTGPFSRVGRGLGTRLGAVIAKSIGFVDRCCYTSQLIVTIEEEMTIECSVHNIVEVITTITDQKLLLATETRSLSTTNIHVEFNDSHQIGIKRLLNVHLFNTLSL